MACTELAKVPSKSTLRFLRKLPKGLNSLYKALLNTALESDEADQDAIKHILSFVVVSLQPLSLSELSMACGLYKNEKEEERIQFIHEEIDSCCLMVIIQDDKVLLLHQSIKDFLLRSSIAYFNEFKAYAGLVHRCVNQLISYFNSNIEWVDFSLDVDFLFYSA